MQYSEFRAEESGTKATPLGRCKLQKDVASEFESANNRQLRILLTFISSDG